MSVIEFFIESFIAYGMTGLFAISLISSLIPIPTEPIVLGLIGVGKNPEIILSILILGSVIGASIGYLIGKYELRNFLIFHSRERIKQMHIYFKKHGDLFLLISPWIPIAGDLGPIVAGIDKYEAKRFLVVISAAKIIKSIGIVYLSVIVIDWLRFIT